MSVCNGPTLKATGSTPLLWFRGQPLGDPESGTDHSLKEVSAYIIWYRVHTLGLQGKCHWLFSVLLFTNNIHVRIQVPKALVAININLYFALTSFKIHREVSLTNT